MHQKDTAAQQDWGSRQCASLASQPCRGSCCAPLHALRRLEEATQPLVSQVAQPIQRNLCTGAAMSSTAGLIWRPAAPSPVRLRASACMQAEPGYLGAWPGVAMGERAIWITHTDFSAAPQRPHTAAIHFHGNARVAMSTQGRQQQHSPACRPSAAALAQCAACPPRCPQ